MTIITELQRFGLSEIEAKVYYDLLKYPNSNGSQISKRINIPRTSVYMSLDKLYSNGFIYLIPSINDRKTYVAVESDQLINKLKYDYTKSIDYLKEELIKVQVDNNEDQFINIKGKENIFNKVNEIISDSKKEIYLNTNVILSNFKSELEQAIKRGVKIILFSFKRHELNGLEILSFNKMNEEIDPYDETKRIMIVSDMKEVFIGDVTEKKEFTGTFTKNNLLVNIISEHIHNDIYLLQLENLYNENFWTKININSLLENKKFENNI